MLIGIKKVGLESTKKQEIMVRNKEKVAEILRNMTEAIEMLMVRISL